MKIRIASKILGTLLLLCVVTWISAQQTTIEYDSDSNDPGDGPQLLLLETENGSDAWSRLWFKNTIDDNRWGFLARPHANTTDNEVKLNQPIIVAHNGVQKFGVSSDGYIRINKKYILPNDIGMEVGMSLQTDGSDTLTWANTSLMRDLDGDTGIRLMENTFDSISINVQNFNIADISNGGVEMYRQATITADDDHLTLVDGFANGPTKLVFKDNDNTDEWDIRANLTNANKFLSLQYNNDPFINLKGGGSLKNIEMKKFTTFEEVLEANSYIRLVPFDSGANSCFSASRGRIHYHDTDNVVKVCTDNGWKTLAFN